MVYILLAKFLYTERKVSMKLYQPNYQEFMIDQAKSLNVLT